MEGGTVDWGELLFSSSGRMARTPFLIVASILLGLAGLYEHFVGHGLLGWLVYPPLLFCGACVLCKRLHDRGRAGWWAGLVLLAIALVWPYPHGPIGLLATPVLVWAIVDLALLPGARGHNPYGPDPAGGLGA